MSYGCPLENICIPIYHYSNNFLVICTLIGKRVGLVLKCSEEEAISSLADHIKFRRGSVEEICLLFQVQVFLVPLVLCLMDGLRVLWLLDWLFLFRGFWVLFRPRKVFALYLCGCFVGWVSFWLTPLLVLSLLLQNVYVVLYLSSIYFCFQKKLYFDIQWSKNYY